MTLYAGPKSRETRCACVKVSRDHGSDELVDEKESEGATVLHEHNNIQMSTK